MSRTISFMAILVLSGTLSAATAQEGEEYVVRFYDVAQFSVRTSSYPFTGRLPASTQTHAKKSMLGAEAMLNADGGIPAEPGGGFFSVPPANGQFIVTDTPAGNVDGNAASDLVMLIKSMIAPATWAMSAQGNAQCRLVGTTLVVRQTAAVHDQVDRFLNRLTASMVGDNSALKLQAWWLPVSGESRNRLKQKVASPETDARSLDAFCDEVRGFRAELRCQHNRTSHTTSGTRRSFVASTMPVVATGASGYSPLIEHVNLGLMLEATPVNIRAASDQSDAKHFQLNLRSALTVDDSETTRTRKKPWNIDTVKIGAHVVESTCTVELNKPAIAGTLTLPPGQTWFESGDQPLDIVHVVLLSAVTK